MFYSRVKKQAVFHYYYIKYVCDGKERGSQEARCSIHYCIVNTTECALQRFANLSESIISRISTRSTKKLRNKLRERKQKNLYY